MGVSMCVSSGYLSMPIQGSDMSSSSVLRSWWINLIRELTIWLDTLSYTVKISNINPWKIASGIKKYKFWFYPYIHRYFSELCEKNHRHITWVGGIPYPQPLWIIISQKVNFFVLLQVSLFVMQYRNWWLEQLLRLLLGVLICMSHTSTHDDMTIQPYQ